ncbi:FdxN element excision controlling factor protein [Nostoc sp. ATCC 43529]|nr:FdxN element excision controlling factor protein [Nostoc sp. ATCC 43529]
MADLEKYRESIRKLITEYAQLASSNNEIEVQTIFDVEQDHYQLIYIGWQNKRRVFGPVMHFDIKNGKIWIQWNGTEEDVGEQLVAMGVPKHDIVVGFHTPYMRQYTDYAVS